MIKLIESLYNLIIIFLFDRINNTRYDDDDDDDVNCCDGGDGYCCYYSLFLY